MRSWSIALVALAVAAMASGHAASAAGRDAPATTGPAPLRNQAAAPSRVPSPAELEAIKAKPPTRKLWLAAKTWIKG